MFIRNLVDEFRPSRLRDEFEHVNRLNAEKPRLRVRWASRSRRRLATALMGAFALASAVLLGVLAYPGIGDGSVLLLLALLAAIGGYLYLFTQLNRAMRTGLRYRSLDERQRVERDHATRVGHHTTGALLMVAFVMFAVLAGPSPEEVRFPHDLVMPLVWLVFMVHNTAPCAYLAWTRPDEILDDEDGIPAT